MPLNVDTDGHYLHSQVGQFKTEYAQLYLVAYNLILEEFPLSDKYLKKK